MIKTIASAVKQSVFCKRFLVSWIGVVAIIAVSSIQQILEAFRADELLMIGFHDTFIANALVSDGVALTLRNCKNRKMNTLVRTRQQDR